MKALEAATRELISRFRRSPGQTPGTRIKAPGALVTDADMASDRAIAAALESFGAPGDILSEESVSERGGGELTWLVDPLCGTTPFSTGMGHWGVNIALRVGNELEVGAMAAPALGETFAAVRGRGASRGGRPLKSCAPSGALRDAAVGLEIDGGPDWARLARSKLHWVERVGQINSFASAAYPLSQVLLGRLHAVVFYRIGVVHLAAGALLAREAGVAVSDARGAALDWSRTDDFECVVAGWPAPHAELIEAMRA